MSRRLLPYGEHAVLVELDDLAAVLALGEAVRSAVRDGRPPFGDVLDVVPAARTVLVAVRDGADVRPLADALATLEPGAPPAPGAAAGSPEVVVEVRYDGPDLTEVAELTGLSPGEVVAAHTGTPWRVAFTGFAPGFAYLVGGDPRLRVPRRDEPRPSVPAGAVGLADEFSAVYPRSSPGGWRLLGRTEAAVWDPERDPPALLRPGAAVRFVDAGAGDRR